MKRAERSLYPLRRTKDEDRAPADDALAFTAHVRFGSKADMATSQRNVRFTPKSGHH
jgi:hypothetical protein